jgi:thiopurine S-methyltransferase
MNSKYWIGRWERSETGWHQTEVEPRLQEYFVELSPTRVFVPLCGKSLDLLWLASQGHYVIGIELSSLACETFFNENQIKYEVFQSDSFKCYQSTQITLFNGDFFNFKSSNLGKIGAVYDRAALIALPSDLRVQYARHMVNLIRSSANSFGFKFLQIVLQRTPHDINGPPFSISRSELKALYGSSFHIYLESSEQVEMNNSNALKTEECVYNLVLKT